MGRLTDALEEGKKIMEKRGTYVSGPPKQYYLAYDPTPHQTEDSGVLMEYMDGLLWADPGTGKTFTTIMAIAKAGFERVVIVCPKIAMTMWKEELEKHLGWRPYIMKRGHPHKGVNVFYREAIIISYDLLARNEHAQRFITKYAEGYAEYRAALAGPVGYPTLMVCDEAHYLKTHTTKRANVILGMGSGMEWKVKGGMRSRFTETWQLTGTPITRHADDLFTQLVAARGEILKHYGVETYSKFVDAFCTTEYKRYHPSGPKQKVVTGSKNLTRLNKLLEDCKVVRRKLKDVVDDLPPITYRTVGVSYKNVDSCNIPGDPAKFMKELNKPDSIMSKIRRQLGVAKVHDTVEYLVESYEGIRPVLVGFWHKDVGRALREELINAGYYCGYIDGETGDKDRDRFIDEFNSGQMAFLIGQVKSMGVAANLQENADRVVVVEELPSPSELEQFIARVYRRGQRLHVHVDLIRSEHDLDEALMGLRNRKSAANKKVF